MIKKIFLLFCIGFFFFSEFAFAIEEISINIESAGADESGLDEFKEFWETRKAQVLDEVEEYPSIPPIYLQISDKYGHMDSNSFLNMHNSNLDNLKSLNSINSIGELGVRTRRWLEHNLLPPTSLSDFNLFLQNDAPALLQKYQNEYRSCNLGGCYPMAQETIFILSDKYGIIAERQMFPVHFYVIVNVDGILYYVDFTFNQFVEDSVATKYGIPRGTGETTGLVIIPLGIQVHEPMEVPAYLDESYLLPELELPSPQVDVSVGDRIVHATDQTVGQIPLIGGIATEGVNVVVGAAEAVGGFFENLWDSVVGEDQTGDAALCVQICSSSNCESVGESWGCKCIYSCNPSGCMCYAQYSGT